ncbi:MAG: 5-(carboxyamino)imidazole ribonucleotide synthase [Alphaproteobacteria bacterium]|jgi:5-(carboxyamino)imidazole ribonucleotide synthase
MVSHNAMTSELLVKPNENLGIIGGGQLGRMMAIEAKRLGIKTIIFSETEDCPARSIADKMVVGSYHDATLLDEFSRDCAVITYEFENIPLSMASYLAMRTHLRPGCDILAVTQDRLSEKTFLNALSIPVAEFGSVAYEGDVKILIEQVNKPIMLKTRRMGYDGKGQVCIENIKNASMAFYDIKEVPAIAEQKIDFTHEFSVVAVRNAQGDFHAYTPVDNIHKDGILHTSTVPSILPQSVTQKGIDYTKKITNSMGYIGVLAVEFFVTKDQVVYANEIAPRVHNSGHWTLDGCYISQFEQHIRAICGWKLGNMTHHSSAVMTNLIGNDVQNWQEYADRPNSKLHIYGKSEIRAGRKMGHVTELTQS